MHFARISHLPAGGFHRDVALHVGVQGQHAQGGLLALHAGHAGFQRKWHDGCQHVAAVGGRIDRVLVRLQLGKQEVEIDPRRRAGTHDPGLAGQRMSPAQTIDLPLVGRTQRGQQHAVAGREIGRQVGLVEKRAT